MKLPNLMPLIARLLHFPWWVKVHTHNPDCIYYFGPFETAAAALCAEKGYLDDLQQEQAEIVTVMIVQQRPRQLTSDANQILGHHLTPI